MKKPFVSILLILIFTITLIPVLASPNEIRVIIEGQEVIFPGQSPVIVDGRTLVPVRGVFEALGFEVDWDGETRQAILTSNNYIVVVTIENAAFTTNGVNHTLDVPAQIIGGSTMLPLRAVLESVGYELEWNEAARTITIASASAVPVPTAQSGRGIIVATAFEPPSLAPGQHNSIPSARINAMHFNGLFRIDADTLLPVPDLASSWRALSDTLFEFTLHENIKFHDGTTLTAHDVAASWELARQFLPTASSRISIVSFEVIDNQRILVDTMVPNAMLFTHLAHHSNMIMPEHLVAAGHDLGFNPVGTGPFVFDYYRAGHSIHNLAFENYFDADRAPRVEYVTWRFIPEGASRTVALEFGEVDFVVETSLPDIPKLHANPNINVNVFPAVAREKLLLNNDLPQFSNPQVRRALGMAIDKEAASALVWMGISFPTRAQIPTVFQGGIEAGTYTFDPSGALVILSELEIDPVALGFNILVSDEIRRSMGEVIQANLAEIGVPVTVQMVDFATVFYSTMDGDFEAAFGIANFPSFLGYMLGTLHSDGGFNRSNFRNAELDALIDQAVATLDTDARIAVYEQISRVANENTPHIPMHLQPHMRAFNSNLIVPEFCPTGALNLNMMSWRN